MLAKPKKKAPEELVDQEYIISFEANTPTIGQNINSLY